jgi:hypothetical protein
MIRALPKIALGVLAAGLNARAQSAPSAPTAEAIMARVAANQDRAVAERAHYVYVQHAKTVSRHGGAILCEETTDYRVAPEAEGSHEELLKVDGRLREKHGYVNYTTLLPQGDGQGNTGDKGTKAGAGAKPDPAKPKPDSTHSDSSQPSQPGKDMASGGTAQPKQEDDEISVEIGGESASIDRQLVENIRHGLMNDESKDGIDAELFPLTSKEQAAYLFRYAGRERMNGRDVFHVVFLPKDRKDFGWRGDAYIDAAAYEPVLVTTGMSRKIPFAVRTFLGTNFPGLGFTVTYAPQPDGVWFPVTFSTEFKIEVLFFFRRTIVLDAQNQDFEKTHVTARIVGDATPVEPEKP